VLVFGLALGTSITVFAVVNAILLRPIQATDPEELLFVSSNVPYPTAPMLLYSEYEFLRAHAGAFSGVMASARDSAWVRLSGASRQLRGEMVSENYFEVLGRLPAAGRPFTPSDLSDGSPPVVIISGTLWKDAFRQAPDAIGQPIVIDRTTYTIVGVAPTDFRGLATPWEPVHFWVPAPKRGRDLECDRPGFLKTISAFILVGRLAPGTSRPQARAQITALAASLRAERHQEMPNWSLVLRDTPDVRLPFASVRRTMPPRLAAAVAGMSLALLGIAIANVAGLMMMRTVSRAPELAIRRALGASEGQIFRQVLYEALILAGVGTILGLVMALVLALVFVGTVPADLAPWQLARPAFEMELMADARVVVFAFALAALAGLAAGMLPAWRSTLLSRAVTLHGGGTMTPQLGRPRLQHLVVLPQVVLAIGLLCVAGALVGQALRSELVESGYDADSLVFADYLVPPPPRCEITKAAVSELMERRRLANRGLLEGAQRLEGVASPALATGLPPALHTSWVVPREAPTHIQVSHTYASLSYFDTLGIRIERGHAFSSVDTAMSQPVAVISMSLARQLWNEDDPLGRDVGLHHLGDPAPPRWLRVIGIAGDIRLPLGDGRPEPMLYTLLDQTPNLLASTLVVKARRDPRSVFGGVRELLEQTDPSLRVYRVQSMSEALARVRYPRRMAAVVLGLGGVLGLLLVTIGLHATVAYSAARRQREFGVRMALGAARTTITRLVLEQAVTLLSLGAALGVPLAIVCIRVASSQAVPLQPLTAATAIIVVILVCTVVLTACAQPARHALRMSPSEILRD
jgi:predicted permease